MITAMATRTDPMTDPAAFLILTQWFSPAYPVGAFAYSHGLEQAVAEGRVSDAASAEGWIGDVLTLGSPRTDVTLLRAAHDADAPALPGIDALARTLAPSKERLLETVQQGQSFTQTTRAIWGGDLPDLTYPVAVGRAARLMGLPLDAVATLYLHAFAANLTSAAIRFVPLGQTEGQAALARLSRLCPAIAAEALQDTLDDIGSCAFLADIASMRHETLYSRIFRS
jgi:urease accessory protein